MSGDGVDVPSEQPATVAKTDAASKPQILPSPAGAVPGQREPSYADETCKNVKLKRDWLDFINTFVLTLAFCAALYAGIEGGRLANLTQMAIDHADTAASTEHADTSLALQKAEAANTLARNTADRQSKDTASSLALSKEAADATVAALDISRAQIRAYFSCSLWARVDPDNRQRVKYICKNTGQSQARKVTVAITFGFRDLVHGNIVPAKQPGIYFVGDLSQGDTDSREGASLSPLPDDILVPGHGAHYIKCTVDYTDIFNMRQTQNFEAWNVLDPTPNPQDFRPLIEPPFGP
jgi:hypothetical protein